MIASTDDSDCAMFQCVSELPQANRDTLAYLVVHFQKVANSPACQMPITNLAKVLGPTIVGHRSPNPLHLEMFEDLKIQPKVSLIANDHWPCLPNLVSFANFCFIRRLSFF